MCTAALLVFFFIFEHKNPYYFLQDDNRTFSLPAFEHAYDTLAQTGRPALFNFHQSLGVPVFQETPVFYPPVYLSVLLSELATENSFAAIDIIVFGHLLLSLWGFFALLVFLGCGAGAAGICSLAWALNGFLIFSSTSSWFITAIAAWFPWAVLLALGISARPSLKKALLLAALRTLMFTVAHHQYFVYAVMVEIMSFAAALLYRSAKAEQPSPVGRAVKFYLLSHIFTVIACLPLLAAIISALAGSSGRNGPLGWHDFSYLNYSLLSWLAGLFYPYSRDFLKYYSGWPHMVQLSHIGYVPLAFASVTIWRLLKRRGTGPDGFHLKAFASVALVIFLWTLGVFNPVEQYIPVLNRFRWHFKLGLFLNFYLILIAAAGLDFFLKKLAGERRGKAVFLLAAVCALNFGALYLLGPRVTFNTFSDPAPLVEPLRNELSDGRIFTVGFMTAGPRNAASLGFNYATLFGLNHFAGYGQLVPQANAKEIMGLNYTASFNSRLDGETVARLRGWGVKWYVAAKASEHRYAKALRAAGMNPAFEDAERVIYKDPAASPLASDGGKPLPVAFPCDVMRIQTDGTTQCARANVLYNRFFKARDETGRDIPVSPDAANRALLCPQTPSRELTLYYSNPFLKIGLAVSALLAAIAALVIYFRRD